MYEYPEIDLYSNIIDELRRAMNYDTLLYQCYMCYEVNYGIERPYNHIGFFKYLAYTALKMNQKHLKLLMTTAEHSVNPSIVIQSADKYYDKDVMDKLIRQYNKTYWQKLWAAIRGK